MNLRERGCLRKELVEGEGREKAYDYISSRAWKEDWAGKMPATQTWVPEFGFPHLGKN